MTLADVLSPIRLEEFLRDYVGQRYVVIRGQRERFHDLLTWQDLNHTLARLRVDNRRAVLVRNGQGLPIDSYVHTFPRSGVQYLDGPATLKHITAGATLVVNQVDELFPAIRLLAESCEQVFHTYVTANLYAGWRKDNAFDVHWDSHDTLVVQVIGHKDWRVWMPTRPQPVPGDGPNLAPKPAADPVWHDTLNEGDVLYMPRGWWHVAYPRNEPSLHVTFGLRLPTGLELLTWVAEQIKGSVVARTNIPHWEGAQERQAWIRAIRDAVAAALNDDVIDTYLDSIDGTAHPRPIVCLSERLSTSPVVTNLTPLRLSRGRHLSLCQLNGTNTLSFEAHGTHWQCYDGLAPALALLSHVSPSTLADMLVVVEERAKPLLRPFVMALVMAGVVWAEPT